MFFDYIFIFLELKKINDRKTPISKLNIFKNMVDNLSSYFYI